MLCDERSNAFYVLSKKRIADAVGVAVAVPLLDLCGDELLQLINVRLCLRKLRSTIEFSYFAKERSYVSYQQPYSVTGFSESTVFARLDRIVSRHILSGSLTSNSCSAALTCVFVLREEFAFLFQTFSRSDPPGKAPLTRGRYVIKKEKEKEGKKDKLIRRSRGRICRYSCASSRRNCLETRA